MVPHVFAAFAAAATLLFRGSTAGRRCWWWVTEALGEASGHILFQLSQRRRLQRLEIDLDLVGVRFS